MNKFIARELRKIKIPMSAWDENTTTIYINKFKQFNSCKADLQLGQTYSIRIENYILNPPPSFTLSANWNNNTYPPETLLEATILQIAGKMVKCKCKGNTTGIFWEGWLPRKSIEIL